MPAFRGPRSPKSSESASPSPEVSESIIISSSMEKENWPEDMLALCSEESEETEEELRPSNERSDREWDIFDRVVFVSCLFVVSFALLSVWVLLFDEI